MFQMFMEKIKTKKTQNIMFKDGKIPYHKDDASFQIHK